MKVKDIVNEGFWSNLTKPDQDSVGALKKKLATARAAEKAAQQQLSKVGTPVTPDAYAQQQAQQVNQPMDEPQDTGAPAPTDKILDKISLQSRSPLVYQIGKNQMFTVDDDDNWVRYIPGSAKPPARTDANTSRILDKAAVRDNIDMARLEPTQPEATPAPQAPQQPAAHAPAPAHPAPHTERTYHSPKARINRATNGDVIITDKNNVQWTKPADKDVWKSSAGGLYWPGSKEYQELSAFNKNLKENKK